MLNFSNNWETQIAEIMRQDFIPIREGKYSNICLLRVRELVAQIVKNQPAWLPGYDPSTPRTTSLHQGPHTCCSHDQSTIFPLRSSQLNFGPNVTFSERPN